MCWPGRDCDCFPVLSPQGLLALVPGVAQSQYSLLRGKQKPTETKRDLTDWGWRRHEKKSRTVFYQLFLAGGTSEGLSVRKVSS